ncbi:hypothetical protein THAOC_09342, partial [Thalassiosira oceanica]
CLVESICSGDGVRRFRALSERLLSNTGRTRASSSARGDGVEGPPAVVKLGTGFLDIMFFDVNRRSGAMLCRRLQSQYLADSNADTRHDPRRGGADEDGVLGVLAPVVRAWRELAPSTVALESPELRAVVPRFVQLSEVLVVNGLARDVPSAEAAALVR